MAVKKEPEQVNTNVKKFKLSKLRENCISIYNVSTHVFDGATAELGNSEYTIDEVGNVIRKWLNKPIDGGVK